MEINSAFLTSEELDLQMDMTNIIYNGTGPEPIYQTASIEKQKIYRKAAGEEEQREAALDWIDVMTNYEFQTRLTRGTLPDFVRQAKPEPKYTPGIPQLVRQTNHPSCLLSEHVLQVGCLTTGYIDRENLRYYSVAEFMEGYYTEALQN
jgi:hypothetical protein